MALGLTNNMRNTSLVSSNGSTEERNTPAQASVWPSAKKLSTATEAGFGWNLNSAKDPPFFSPSPKEQPRRLRTEVQNLSICLVEDNPGDVALIREALTEHDVRADLVLFEDGERAFGYFQELDQNEGSCPDLLLLDLNLPKVSGWEVFDFVRRSARCASVSVIVLSSSD